MKAAQINSYGDASVIQITDVPTPTAGNGQVLIEVRAASLNPFDTKVREGQMKEMIPLQFPATLGGDIAGIVTAIGGDVTNVTVGDKVYGEANVVAGNSGAFAEFAATASNQIAKMPENLDFNEAASLPLVGVSALQALTQHINLQPGQKIFIYGGTGGIGMVAIQIAKHIGAFIATTATGDGIEFARQLGTDEVIDYKQQDFTEVLSNYDAVFDTVGGDDFNKSLSILKPAGIAVSMTMQADEAIVLARGVTAITQSTHVTTKNLHELCQLVEAGIVTPRIGKIFPLMQIHEAFKVRESSATGGKIVLEIQ